MAQHTISGKLVICFISMSMVFLASKHVEAGSNEAEADRQLPTRHSASLTDINGDRMTTNEFIQQNGSVHEQDSLALVALYHSMNGESWKEQGGWLQEPVVFWNGVEEVEEVADGEWRVVRMRYYERWNHTECGYIPPEIAELEYLYWWASRENLICGNWPAEIADMEHMERIRSRGTYFNGEFPWQYFVQIENLWQISLEQNFFSGEIFPEYVAEELPNFVQLRIDENEEMTGRFPENMGDLQDFERLYADGLPNIHGPIPDLSETSIERLEIQNSNFDPGPVPEWLQNASERIDRLTIKNTNRTGGIPEWLTDFPNLREFYIGGPDMHMPMDQWPDFSFQPDMDRLWIEGGDFPGNLPDWVANMPVLDRLWIRNTNVGGDMEEHNHIWQEHSWDLIKLENTNFSGKLPEVLSLATGLNQLSTAYSNLEIGELPEWLGDISGLSRIYLADSGVEGNIHDFDFLTNPDNMTSILLQDNPGIVGDGIPDWLWTLDLWRLDLSYTSIEADEFPSEIRNQTNLVKLGLAGLGMEGPIPDWLGEDLEFIRTWGTRDRYPYISLADNNLSGEIPQSMGNLIQLDSLNLANNQLEGSIDPLLGVGQVDPGELHVLSALDVSGNPDLTGEIPEGFTSNNTMRVFHYDGTGLCAPSESFVNWLGEVEERRAMHENYGLLGHGSGFSYTSVRANDEGCDFVVSAEDIQSTPYTFRLNNNYPNPFNPTTSIQYEIPENGMNVRLEVFNVIGERVAVLVNEEQNAGSYTVSFDASNANLSSGVYIFRLQADGRQSSQKMTFVK